MGKTTPLLKEVFTIPIPNSTLKLLKGCLLDNTYEHTIYFNSEKDRYNSLNSLTAYTLNGNSYIRVDSETIRVQIPESDLFGVSYLIFDNTGYTSKNFYCFVTGVKYINDKVTEIYFEVDVIQTYFKPEDLRTCFVEREHVVDDTIGSNITKENLTIGDYVRELNPVTSDLGETNLFVQIGANALTTTVLPELRGTMKGVLYDGFIYIPSQDKTVESVYNIIRGLTVAEGLLINVISVVTAPFDKTKTTNTGVLHFNKKRENLDGYKPKNNKLYTYPYTFTRFFSTNGAEINIRNEFIEGDNIDVTYSGVISNDSPFRFSLQNYSISNEPILINMGVSSNYMSDTTVLKLGLKLGTTALNVVSQGLATPVTNTINETTTQTYRGYTGRKITDKKSITTSTNKSEEITPNNSIRVGDLIGGNMSFTSKTSSLEGENIGSIFGTANLIFFEYCTQPSNILKQIDDYFSMYGYNISQIKKPNLNGRPHWNYVKTNNCVVTTKCSVENRKLIESIFNRGITFWKRNSEIGDYSLDNSIRG